MDPKDEVIDFISDLQKIKGLDELSSRIIGILFIEPKEVSMEELSSRTGYSLSAVSTSMKFLIKSPSIKKIKKPGSKKLYFYMEKDLGYAMVKVLEEKIEKIMGMAINRMPELIGNYKRNKPRNYKEEVRILEKYYKQIIIIEKVTKKFKEMLKKEVFS